MNWLKIIDSLGFFLIIHWQLTWIMANPLYPLYVSFYVAPSILELHSIYIWQFLFEVLGKRRAFLFLLNQYQHQPQYFYAIIFFVASFLFCWIITVVNRIRHEIVEQNHYLLRLERFNIGHVERNDNNMNAGNFGHNHDDNRLNDNDWLIDNYNWF